MQFSLTIARYTLFMGVFIFLSSSSAHSQNMGRMSVEVGSGPFAKNHRDHSVIDAQRFVFADPIYRFAADSTTGTIHVQLRGKTSDDRYRSKGYVAQYQPGLPQILWFKKINYLTEDISYINDVLIHSSVKGTKRIVPLNGRELWTVKNSVISTDAKQEIIIGYAKNATGKSANLLNGYDLQDGSMRWKRMIDRTFGWDGMKYLNDSTLLISASGLHTLDLRTGRGWDYPMETGRKYYGTAAAMTALGILTGALTGTYMISTGADIIHGIVSDPLFDSTGFFIADRNHLVHLDREGREVWSSMLPHDLTSHMELFRMGDRVVVVNFGYANKNYREFPLGNAFLAAFNVETGEQEFLNFLSNEHRKQTVEHAMPVDDRILRLVFFNYVADVSVAKGGEEQISHTIDVGTYGNLLYSVGKNTFIKSDSLLLPLEKADPTGTFVFTNRETVLHITPDKQLANEYTMDDLFIRIHEYRDQSFLFNSGAMWMVDPSGRIVAEFPNAEKIQISDGKFYVSRDNELWMFDLDELFSD